MPSIFVSYRRADSRPFTERIHDKLVLEFGKENVFLDVDNNIPAGSNFPEVLMSALNQSYVTLVIIGNQWLDIRENNNPDQRRLDNHEDFVRIEVEDSLQQPFVSVIPLLVNGSIMPSADQLPDSMKSLAPKQASLVRPNPDFHNDMIRLIKEIRREIDKNVDLQNKTRLEQERLAQEEQTRLEQEQKAKQEQEQQKELAQLEPNTKNLLNLLDIPFRSLEINKTGQFTEEQQKSLPKNSLKSIIQNYFWADVIIVFIFLTAWLAFGEILTSFLPYLQQICVGTFITVLGASIYFMTKQITSKKEYKLEHFRDKLLNVHQGYKETRFSVGRMSFTIEIDNIYKQLREYEDFEVEIYFYSESSGNKLLGIELINLPEMFKPQIELAELDLDTKLEQLDNSENSQPTSFN